MNLRSGLDAWWSSRVVGKLSSPTGSVPHPGNASEPYVHVGMDPIDVMALRESGYKLLDLLTWSQDWLHRRIDSIRLDGQGSTRRHVSIDFSLPKSLAIYESIHRVLIPVTFLEKGTISKLDTNDVGNKHTSVLNTEQNRVCAISLLMAAAERHLPVNVPSDVLKDRIAKLVECPKLEAQKVKGEFSNWVKDSQSGVEGGSAGFDDVELFVSMATQFADKFLLVVSIDKCVIGDRAVLKYSFDQEAPNDEPRGTIRTLIKQDIPDFGMAKSQHIEVRVPPELVIDWLYMYEVEDGRTSNRDLDYAKGQKDTAHCSLRPSARDAHGKWILRVRPSPQGLYSFTKNSIWVIFILMFLGSIVRILDLPVVNWSAEVFPSPSVSIILVGPAVLLSWLSRQREHPISARVQAPLRWMLLLCSGTLVGLAVLASVPLREAAWNVGWGLATVVALAGWVWLQMYRRNIVVRPVVRLLRRPAWKDAEEMGDPSRK